MTLEMPVALPKSITRIGTMRKRIPMQQAVFMLGGDDGRRDNSLSSSSSSPMISSSAASSSSESLSASNLLPPRRPLVVLRPLPPGLPPDRPCIESPRAIFFAVTRLRPVGRAAAFRYAEGCSPTDSSERCVGFLTDGGRAGGRATSTISVSLACARVAWLYRAVAF